MTMSLEGCTVLVTGANGGLGRQFVQQALDRGAQRVYAAARSPREWHEDRIVSLQLDVTDAASLKSAVESAGDTDLLINNAGVAPVDDASIATGSEALLREVFETNFFGPLQVAKSFAPILSRNGGGTVLNVLSAASWMPLPTAYAASKGALWSVTGALRAELRSQGTHVVGLLVGMVDTPLTAQWDVAKVSAASVVEQAYDGIEAGAFEVLADQTARQLKARLGADAEDLLRDFDSMMSALTSSSAPAPRSVAP